MPPHASKFNHVLTRREFINVASALTLGRLINPTTLAQASTRPNVIIIFADQLRYQSIGFAGNPDVQTPNLDQLASESLHFTTAVSCCAVCSPARASLLTGQYPLEHGVFINDVPLSREAISLADIFKEADYATAYIGKWHLNGSDRSAYIPPEERQGFDFWRSIGVSHDYNESYYYADNDPEIRVWDGYDAIAQTREAQHYITGRDAVHPFLLVLSWGPPHPPYDTAPEYARDKFNPAELILRPNVPASLEDLVRPAIAGYYAHISVLDDQIGALMETIQQQGIQDNTIVIFWSDHGDMLGSQDQRAKLRPWDESIRVPLLIRYPRLFGSQGQTVSAPINAPDLMPTLLDLCDIPIPRTVTGHSYTPYLLGSADPPADACLIACYQPFGAFSRELDGGREYRGLRTVRYTYVRDMNGPWLLYDNNLDPYQQNNLVDQPAYVVLQTELDRKLNELLINQGDKFLPGQVYLDTWGYSLPERSD
jgi:arylsulfatase A-like enzyme